MTARTSTALAAALALLANPLVQAAHAQETQDTPRLEDLIPDAAVENPEDWASQGVPPSDQADANAQAPLDADAPLAAMPMVTIPWPEDIELPQLAPLEAEDPIEFVQFDDAIPRVPTGSEERVSEELVLVFPTEQSLFPQRDEFLDRFKALSTIEQLDDDDNLARLAAQARADEALLQQLLDVYGYFDAQVIRTVGQVDATTAVDLDRPAVRFDIVPGQRFTVGAIDLGNLQAAGDQYDALRSAYEINVGDPISLDKIEEEQFDLDTALGESGFPFATIDAPSLLVDHDREEGDITMPVEPNGRYRFGTVISSDPEFLSSRHLTTIARWDEGDIYTRSDEMDLRRAMLATGLLGSVELTPVVVQDPANGEPGIVDIEAELSKAPLRTLAGSIGFGTEEGIRLAGSWEHRNLFPPEGMLRVRGILGTQEQLAGVTFRKNNFKGRDRILTVDAFASTIDYDAYDARTASLIGTYERVSTLLFQKAFSWSVGLELVATQESERNAAGETLDRENYFIAALPLYAQLDNSDDLLDPTKGWRLSGRLSPEISENEGIKSFYIRSQADATYYKSVGENTVLAGRVRFASIPGAPLEAIAPSRRLYAGGGGSVRGYGYREIGPLNSSGNPLGGRSLVELSAEARIGTGFMDGAVSVVPFVDAGSVGLDPTPDFQSIKFGAGVGVRYATGFGPLRLDVAFPLNPGPNDNWVAVYVALGQAF
ncbi:autotransporter assembly complex protein TamA [Aurantiacibacter rhizosphaerae]|uniref:BamA/TamA family outer membrane protein n=1 Tax=Aurantiacibacter rhizosphaerae TaxID=2691582 RepID=A0A844XBK0_9SPHN|nr:BamA/TamA family outer membrane protein [Aurantiacibacter rhizosphaerae]MWV27356.1 BamA/TamA family outer membrane protein [Aurantiacibacter rhizosphaerae]